MADEDIWAFVRASIRSVWALELLLLLRRFPDRAWPRDELIRELRASLAIVTEELASLQRAGLCAEEAGQYRYSPASPQVDTLVGQVQDLYAARPMALVKAIMAAPNDKLRIFSDAFKLKD